MTNLTLGTSAIRELDGLYSLNDLHQASGGNSNHKPAFFLRNDQTKALIIELAKGADLHLFLKITRGRSGGTYVCRELVIAYAAWISPAFHLKVIRVFLAVAAPQPAAGDLRANPALDRLREARFLLSFDHEDRIQIMSLDADACVLSPSRSSSMTTLVREYVPPAVLSDMLFAGIARLARRAG
jgi:hypothetical protein